MEAMVKGIVLVDTDPGIDDCAALMMLMSHSSKVKIVGLTCAAGNVGIRHVLINTVRIVKLFNKLDEIPIYRGCTEPMVLLPDASDSVFYHGKDGLGDAPDVYPERSESFLAEVQAERAVDAIIRLSKGYEGQLQILCLGALTNIAMAAKLDPDFPKRLKSLHILGGTIKGYGNSSPCAEYNFFTDPEAAYNVFRTFPQHCPTDVVPFETTLDHGLPPEKFYKMTSGNGNRKRFFREIFKACEAYEKRSIARGISTGYCFCDAYLAAVVLDPNIVKKAKYARVAIELGGCVARGSFIIDHKGKGSPHLSHADVRIVEAFDDGIYENLISKAFEE